MDRIRVSYGLLSLLTLVVGIGIYLLFRNLTSNVLFGWVPKPEFVKTVLVPLKASVFTNIVRYHLPDALWFVSAILFLRFVCFYNIKMQTAYILCFYGIALVLEVSQLSKKVLGTFDWFDLFIMGVGAFVEGLLYKFFIIRRLA